MLYFSLLLHSILLWKTADNENFLVTSPGKTPIYNDKNCWTRYHIELDGRDD